MVPNGNFWSKANFSIFIELCFHLNKYKRAERQTDLSTKLEPESLHVSQFWCIGVGCWELDL